jgi:hypothetical protein
MSTGKLRFLITLLGVAVLHTTWAQTNYSVPSSAGVSGANNTSVGYNPGRATVTSNDNTFTGYMAGNAVSTGGANSFYGSKAGINVTSGANNTFIGVNAGGLATTATYSVFLGGNAGANTISTANNTFLGFAAGSSNTSAQNNTFVGTNAGYTITTGNSNTSLGSQSGFFTPDASFNTAIGYYAGYQAGGSSSLFAGYHSGMANTGGNNVFLGESAGESSGAAANTVAVGFKAGINATGSNNVYLGAYAGSGETGTNKLYIENSNNLTTPLIYGDFASNQVSINTKPVSGSALTVKGTTYVDGPLKSTADVSVGTGLYLRDPNPRIVLSDNIPYLQIYEANNELPSGIKAGGSLIADDVTYANPASNDLIVKGHIGIGTPLLNNPNNYALAVNGAIGAQDLRIENNSATWPDYVFSKGYNLPRIAEVEKYVAENNHLEGVPSAEEVQKNGHSVADMDAILLKKVEELTLYIIQQQKQLEAQQKELDALKKQLKK